MAGGAQLDAGENEEQWIQQVQNLALLPLAAGLIKTHLEEGARHLMDSGLPPFLGAEAILKAIHTSY